MNKRKILTLNDLYDYYSTHCTKRSQTFTANDSGENIVVSIPMKARLSENEGYDSTEGLRPVVIKACHDGLNENRSFIFTEAMENALSSFSNRPILAFMYKDNNGEYQFYDHRRHKDDEEIVYDEVPIGVVRENSDAHVEQDGDKKYTIVNGYIYETYYPHAIEILDREDEVSVSVEIEIRDLTYNVKDKILYINDYFYTGVTCLGYEPETNEKIEPAMVGANIKLADFKQSNELSQEIMTKLEEINQKISFSIENSEKGGQKVKFEELLAKYGKTAEDITFEFEGLTDDELEAKFEEVFASPKSEPEGNFTAVVNGVTFSTTVKEELAELTKLVNSTYNQDDDWYCVDFDDKYIYMIGWNNSYRQAYSKENEGFSLIGEREIVKAKWVSEEEEKTLDEMRANYPVVLEKIQNYEAEPDKMKILNSEDYELIKDNEEFITLKNEHFSMSVSDVAKKADEILCEAAKHASFTKTKAIPLPNMTPTKRGRYGGLSNN